MVAPLRLVFCGTPQFAVPTLTALAEVGHEIALVLTQPDRPSGRGMHSVASPVKQWSLAHNLAVEQPGKIRSNEPLRSRLEAIAADAIVVVAYGRILPPWMLGLPRLGCINLHGSLLPKYRGAAPVQWAVANGESLTGVTTMLLEEGLDTGPILEQREIAVHPDDMADVLFPALAGLGAPLVVSTLAGLASGALKAQPQDGALATHAPLLTREDGHADFSLSARSIYNRWRGFRPWPGVWSTLEGRKLSLEQIVPVEQESSSKRSPGTLWTEDSRLFVACGEDTALELLSVKLEGKRAIHAAEFLRGHPQVAGARLG